MAHTERLAQLLENLVKHFDLNELRTLCFDLGVNYDDLGGEGITAKARELITVMLRQNRLAELADRVQVLCPNVDWPNVQALSPKEGLAWTTATEMQSAADYLAALRDYCASLPYLSLHDIRPAKTLDEVYVPLRADSSCMYGSLRASEHNGVFHRLHNQGLSSSNPPPPQWSPRTLDRKPL